MDLKQIEEAAEKHAIESFVPARNKEGEIMTLPAGQSIPNGFNKHKKIAISHFKAGAIYQHNQDKETIQELVKALKEISQIVNPSLLSSFLDMKKIAYEALLKVKS